MELKISVPLLPPLLLFPLVILLDRILPILLPLNVLSAFLCVCSLSQCLSEFQLPFTPRSLAHVDFELGGFVDELGTVLTVGVMLVLK